jgi:hypothetical protein
MGSAPRHFGHADFSLIYFGFGSVLWIVRRMVRDHVARIDLRSAACYYAVVRLGLIESLA